MKIRHTPPFHDDNPIESDIDFIVRCKLDNLDEMCDFVSELLVLLHSKNIINDDELLSLIGERDGEVVK